MDSAAIKVEGHGTTRVARRADVPSLWLVVGFLLLQQLVLTLIHYALCPALGIGLLSAGSVIVTIIGASAIMLAIVAMDFRRPGRARAVLATIPRWDRSTVVVMLAGMAIAQLPLVYLAVSGKTVWQSGPGSHLAVGEALRTSLATICGLGVLLATVIVAPIVEELLYRGYLLGSLVGRVPPVLAIIVSAFLFVTLHAEAANLVAAFCLGLGTALCAVRTGSILPGLVVHLASNAFGMWYATLG